MINQAVFSRFTALDGRSFVVYANADKLEKHMLELSPADSENIHLLCRLIRRFTRFQMPIGKPFELYTLFDILRSSSKWLLSAGI